MKKSYLARKFLVVNCWVIAFSFMFTSSAMSAGGDPLYGFTPEGVFFIHKTLVEAAEGSRPKITGDFNNWKREQMESHGSYYVYEASVTGKLPFACYCFSIGGERYLPHVLVAKGSPLINSNDFASNGKGGFNFMTKALSFDPR